MLDHTGKTLLEPTTKIIDGKEYILSKFPAIQGREIITQYPTSAIPKVGDYKLNQELMFKLLCFVAVARPDGLPPLALNTQELVNNHIHCWETLVKIEKEMMVYNCSFFQEGRVSNFLEDIARKLPQWISKMLMDSLAQLSKTEKQATTS